MTEKLPLNEYTLERFLATLFKPGEQTCFATHPYDVQIASKPAESSLWFSINPLRANRSDANVVSYRNFLLELDSVPLNQQIELVRSKIPVTSIVYSGSKSYHFIISLQEDLPDKAAYRRVIRGLMEAIPEADKSTKNPSRLSRLPFRLRPETNLLQELVYLGSPIPLAKLPEPAPYHEPKPPAQNVQYVSSQLLEVLHTGVDNYIAAHFSGRNQFFYWLGKRCSELGHTRPEKQKIVDKYYDRLDNKRGFTKAEAYAAARVKF